MLTNTIWEPGYCTASLLRSENGNGVISNVGGVNIRVPLNPYAATSFMFNIGWRYCRKLDFFNVDLCCLDYLFPSAWLSMLYNDFRDLLDFGHRFGEKITPSSIFVLWYCVEASLNSSRYRALPYLSVDCPE